MLEEMNSLFTIRFACRKDVPAIIALIKELAAYENLADSVIGNAEALEKHLFEQPCYAEVLVSQWDDTIVGFALFFSNYSTFLTQPGIYLEDLFVLPGYRRQGIGTALLRAVAKIATQRGAGRLEWSVLEWNDSAMMFYETMGATVLPDWRICRVSGDKISQLAQQQEE